jgi:FtsZ-binding cell division protein ZapB
VELLPGQEQQAEPRRAGGRDRVRRTFYQDEIKRYKAEKNDIKAAAEKLEAEAKAFDQRSEQQMHQHHRWAQATTALQVAIAMAAIALLTRRRWTEYAVYGLSAIAWRWERRPGSIGEPMSAGRRDDGAALPQADLDVRGSIARHARDAGEPECRFPKS